MNAPISPILGLCTFLLLAFLSLLLGIGLLIGGYVIHGLIESIVATITLVLSAGSLQEWYDYWKKQGLEE